MTKTATNLLYVLAALLFTVGCGHYPAPIRSAWSIKTTPASEYMVVIDGLPLTDWPQLAKFRDLQHFNIAQDFAASVTDAHLAALSKADFPKLRQVSLAYAGRVTDAGLNSFTNFRSVQGFQLIGVGITDKGLETLATAFPNLEGINVEQCGDLTPGGFRVLARSPTIKDVSLTLDPLSQKDIEDIIVALPNITRWTIGDPQGRLSASSLGKLARERNVMIFVADKQNSVSRIEEAQPATAPYSEPAARSPQR